MENKEQTVADTVTQDTMGFAEQPESPASNSQAATEERLARLEQELQTALQTKDELHNRLLRNQADFDNFRRRSRQEYEQMSLCAGEDLVKKILPVLDSLERAIRCYNGELENNCSWQEGVELTFKQFQSILAAEGLEAVPAVEQAFDPMVHEAVLQEEREALGAPVVVEELQRGYKYRGKLLRPALVKVAVPRQ